MEKKIIDLNNSLFTLVNAYPELVEILLSLGFKDIVKPGMIQTAGRFMTIPKGAAMKKIDLGMIISIFSENGFDVQLLKTKNGEQYDESRNQ